MQSPCLTGPPRRCLLPAALIGLFVATAPSASAAYVNAKWTGTVAPGLSGVQYSIDSGSTWTTTSAGIYNWDANPTVPWVGEQAQGFFWTMCIELREYTPGTGQSYNYQTTLLQNAPRDGVGVGGGGPMGSSKADAIRELFGYLQTSTANGGQGFVFESDSVPSLTNKQAAAIHMAVWEIVYEDSGAWGVTSGDTRFNGSTAVLDARALAQTYLDAITGGDFARSQNIMAITDNGASNVQDQLFILNDGWVPNNNGDVSAVPVPPAAVLALLGVMPAAALVRRSRRATADV